MTYRLNTCSQWIEVVQELKMKECGWLKFVCKIGIPTQLLIYYIPKYN